MPINGWFFQTACLGVSEEHFFGLGNRSGLRFLNFLWNLAICFPVTDLLLCFLPITHLQGFAHLLAIQKAVHPNWAMTVAVLSAFVAVLARLAMPTVDGQH